MAFSQGHIATVWDVEDRETYAVVDLSTSKRKKDGSGWENDFSNKFVRFVGEAYKGVIGKQSKDKIRIGQCAAQTYKAKDGAWRNSFTVFTFEELDENPPQNNTKKDDGELPY